MNPVKRYPYLLWDVDGTLLDFEYSMKVSLVKCLKNIGITATEEMIKRYDEINAGWWKRLERGEVTKAELLPGRFHDLFCEFHIECPDIDAYLKDFQLKLGQEYKHMENSLEVCQKLKDMGYHQFVVTNGVTITQEMKLKLSGFSDIMEELFISEQMGAPKPHADFFDKCFEQISKLYPDFDKKQALIIGDSLSSDMAGGVNAGIDTCWYNPLTDGVNSRCDCKPESVCHMIYSLNGIFEVV